jgi:hypothetical protein
LIFYQFNKKENKMQRITVPPMRLELVAFTRAGWLQRVIVRRDGGIFMQAEGSGRGTEIIRRNYVIDSQQVFEVSFEHKVEGRGEWIVSNDRVSTNPGDPSILFIVEADDSYADGDYQDCVLYFKHSR